MLTREDTASSERAIMSLEKPRSGWRTVTAVLDSGAEETVAPPGLLPGRLESSPMSRAGGRFRAANGTRIPNLGQQVAAFTTAEGHSCSLRFQIAGVERPLISVSQLARTGHTVEFSKDMAVVTHRASGRKLKLPRIGGVYVLKMRVRDVKPSTEGPVFSRPGK